MTQELREGLRVRRHCDSCGNFASQTVSSVPPAIQKGGEVRLQCNGGHEARVPRYALEAEISKGQADVM